VGHCLPPQPGHGDCVCGPDESVERGFFGIDRSFGLVRLLDIDDLAVALPDGRANGFVLRRYVSPQLNIALRLQQPTPVFC